MKRYWVNELAIIEIDDFNFDYDKPQWKKVYLASEVDAERAKDRKNYEDALTDMVKEKNEEIEEYKTENAELKRDVKTHFEKIVKQQYEIARLKKGEEQLSETATLLAVEIAQLIESYNKAVEPLEQDVKRLKEEIAQLRKALEEIVMISDKSAFLDDLEKCIVVAREALEGEYAYKKE